MSDSGASSAFGLPKLSRAGARKAFIFLSNFGAAKVAIYFIPLAFAALLSSRIYGLVELSQSIGLLASGYLVGAPLAGWTQRRLIRGDLGIADLMAAIVVIGCGTVAALLLLAILAGAGEEMRLLIAGVGGAVLHQVASTIFRTLNLRSWAAWADGTAMLLCGVIVLAAAAIGEVTVDALTWGYGIAMAASIAAASVILVRGKMPRLGARLHDFTIVGLPMLAVGGLATWLGVGGRILVGAFHEPALAAYGVAFRILGLALAVHQVVATAFFVRLYRSRTRDADTLLGLALAVVGITIMALAAAAYVMPEVIRLEALPPAAVPLYHAMLAPVGLQVLFWIGYAMLQIRVNRSGLAKRAIVPTALLTGVGIAAIVAIDRFLAPGPVMMCWTIAAHSAAYFALNAYLLARKGLPHRRTVLAGSAAGALLLGIGLIVLPWT